jgi:large subunit ribosomal protein L24
MAKFSVKKDDFVVIIAGKDKGKTAQVTAVNQDKGRVLIEGKDLTTVNKKAVKARQASDKGGIITQAGSVDISNVMPLCSACNKPCRVNYKEVDGKSVRVCNKCDAVLVTKKAAAKKVEKVSKAKAKAAEAEVKKDEAVAEDAKPAVKTAVRKKAKPAEADSE